MSKWFYAFNGAQAGPISEAELRQLLATGTIAPDNLIWTEGMPQWLPASTALPPLTIPNPTIPSPSSPATVLPPYQQQPHGYAAPYPAQSVNTIGYFNPTHNVLTNYAGWWFRFLAVLIDGILLYVVNLIVSVVVTIMVSIVGGQGSEHVAWLIGTLLGYLIAWLYEAIMISKSGSTLGKMALGIRVVRSDGNTITFARATGRHFAKFLSFFTLLIGYIMAAFTQKKQALHDIISDTVVISTR